jgi:hypothetical protein
MANESIGRVKCPFFPGEFHDIREAKTRSGKYPLYIFGSMGQVFMKSTKGQNWIKQHAEWYDNAPAVFRGEKPAHDAIGKKPDTKPDAPADKKPEVKPEPATPPAEHKTGFFL